MKIPLLVGVLLGLLAGCYATSLPMYFNAFRTPTNNTGTIFSVAKLPDGTLNPDQPIGNTTIGGIYAGKKPNGANYFALDLGIFGMQWTDETGSCNTLPTLNPAAPWFSGFNATNTFEHELAEMARCSQVPQTVAERGIPGLASQVCYFGSHLDAGSVGAAPIPSLFCVSDLLGTSFDNRLLLWRSETPLRPRDPQTGACLGDIGIKALIQVHTPQINSVSPNQYNNLVNGILKEKLASCAQAIPANIAMCYV